MLAINDPKLPGLADLSKERLCKVTRSNSVALMRLRYRAGKRAILHVATGEGAEQREGVLWFFGGDKARRLARRNKSAYFDPNTQSLYECFPNDHRMPQIRQFLTTYSNNAPAVMGAEPDGDPVLLRYRPGLSCTFRCAFKRRSPTYVKLLNDDSPERVAAANLRMCKLLKDGPVSVVPMIGLDQAHAAVIYAAAPGLPLDQMLQTTANLDAMHQAIDALRLFWRLPLVAERRLTPQVLRYRAVQSAAFVAVTAPACNAVVSRFVDRIQAHEPRLKLAQIHGDIKLEHLFVNDDKTIMIDTESVSIGPPDYDLAQLYGRLWQAEMEGQLPLNLVTSAAVVVSQAAGPGFQWCLDVVALRLAKFYAQRPTPEMASRIHGILRRLG